MHTASCYPYQTYLSPLPACRAFKTTHTDMYFFFYIHAQQTKNTPAPHHPYTTLFCHAGTRDVRPSFLSHTYSRRTHTFFPSRSHTPTRTRPLAQKNPTASLPFDSTHIRPRRSPPRTNTPLLAVPSIPLLTTPSTITTNTVTACIMHANREGHHHQTCTLASTHRQACHGVAHRMACCS